MVLKLFVSDISNLIFDDFFQYTSYILLNFICLKI